MKSKDEQEEGRRTLMNIRAGSMALASVSSSRPGVDLAVAMAGWISLSSRF